MLTKEQQALFNQVLNEVGPGFTTLLGQLLSPEGGDYQQAFQQSYVNPALQALEQQIVPSIQQRFVDANAASSSALNQALAQAAEAATTNIGANYGNFLQNQQQLGLNAFLPLLGAQTFSPVIQQQQGLAGPLLSAAGSIGAGWLSTVQAKENIRDYGKALETLRALDVKQYDYKKGYGGQKDRVGFIAEELPEEMTIKKDNMLYADVYGLVGLAVNAIKELESRISELEGGK